jgi:UDP-N-acetylmuramate--alanine ligase
MMLSKAGLDPTVIVGTKLKEFNNSNCRVGKSKYLVIEADEHMASFLNYWPKMIVLTRIDKDHLDYYKNLNNIKKAFVKFIGHLPNGGVLVANKDDENIQELLNSKSESANWRRNPKQIINQKSKFSVQSGSVLGGKIKILDLKQINVCGYSISDKEAKTLKQILKIPGEHNVSNALAAYRVGQLLKIPKEKCLKALGEYRGAWRRFEERSLKINNKNGKNIKIVSDYGHHPTEIEVTLKAAREKYSDKKIWCVFQPHQYQRTYYLFKDFVRVLSKAPVNKLIVVDIYGVAGREDYKTLKQVNSGVLVSKIKAAINGNRYLNKDGVLHIKDIKKTEGYVKKNICGGEVVIIMGAGDIYDLTRAMIKSN